VQYRGRHAAMDRRPRLRNSGGVRAAAWRDDVPAFGARVLQPRGVAAAAAGRARSAGAARKLALVLDVVFVGIEFTYTRFRDALADCRQHARVQILLDPSVLIPEMGDRPHGFLA